MFEGNINLVQVGDGGDRARSLSKLSSQNPVTYQTRPMLADPTMAFLKMPSFDRFSFNGSAASLLNRIQPGGLRLLELSNAAKQCPQKGNAAFGYIPEAKWVFKVKTTISDVKSAKIKYALTEMLNTMRRRYDDHYGEGATLSACSLSERIRSDKRLRYKRGSNYGIASWVAGSSSDSDKNLAWYAMVAIMHDNEMTHNRKFSPGRLGELLNSCGASNIPSMVCDSMVLFSRTGPIKEDKFTYGYRLINRDGNIGLEIASKSKAQYPRLRWIQAVNAARNLHFTPTAAWFSDATKVVRGLHVGHQITNSSDAVSLMTSTRSDLLEAYDLSKYDITVQSPVLHAFADACRDVLWSGQPWLGDMDKDNTRRPLTTAAPEGVFSKRDEGLSDLLMYDREAGIVSGEQLTTMKGTMVHLAIASCVISDMTGEPVEDVISASWNFSESDSSKWGCLMKGDDIAGTFNGYGLTMNDIIEGVKEYGLTAEAEAAPVFLMNFIDPSRMVNVAELPDYVAPASIKSKVSSCFYTTGIMSRRIGSCLFPEYQPGHRSTAILGLTDRLAGVYLHPKFTEVSEGLTPLVSKSLGFSARNFTALCALISSQPFKDELRAYSTEMGGADSFLRERAGRLASDMRAGDDDGEDADQPPFNVDDGGVTDLIQSAVDDAGLGFVDVLSLVATEMASEASGAGLSLPESLADISSNTQISALAVSLYNSIHKKTKFKFKI